MTRATLAAALALVVTGCVAIPSADAAHLEDLLWDLQIVPLEDVAPPFTLEALGGGRRSLAQFRGRPVLLYFWEST